MVDRIQVYPGAIPLDTDILLPQQNTMIALGYALQASYGQNTVVFGLPCTATAPASMQVSVGPGGIVTPNVIETTAFGSLPSDTADALIKMGINITATLFTLSAPGSAGQSQNYMIQAAFSEADDTPATLTYFNSLNPTQPFTGPNNSGTPQNTRRAQRANLQLKVGTPANTGTQVTPPVDSGWTGIYVITVNYGQTSITSGAISVYPNAPFLAAFLSSHHGGVPGQAPKINLAAEVSGVLPYGNLPTSLRITATSAVTIYVDASAGIDTNDGLTTGTALLTLSKAISIVSTRYDHAGFTPTIKMANGTYTGGVFFGSVGLVGTNNISLVGNVSSVSSVTVNGSSTPAISCAGINLNVSGFTITATGTPGNYSGAGHGIVTGVGGNITMSGPMGFGACGGYQMYAFAAGSISTAGQPIRITGGAQCCFGSSAAGNVTGVLSTITLVGTPAYSVAFALALESGICQLWSMTFTGTATGYKYDAATGGTINTQAAGINYLPGSIAGITSTGGNYI